MIKERIAIRVPCGYYITAAVTAVMIQLTKLNAEPSCRFEFDCNFVSNLRPADYARNVIIKEFLAGPYDRLFMIDSDIIPSPILPRLLWVDADIAAGLYPLWGQMMGADGVKRDKPEVQWAVYDWMDRWNAYKPAMIHDDGVRRHDAVGTGTILIRRNVLEDPEIRYKSEYENWTGAQTRLSADDPPCVFLNRHKPNGQFDASEDIDFCLRASKLGYTIAADHAVKSGHIKDANVIHIMDYALASYQKGFTEALEQGQVEQELECPSIILPS